MFALILRYGLIAGVIVAAPMLWQMLTNGDIEGGYFFGYLMMLVALSAVFFGVKQYRDKHQGGVIKFGRAFLVGLGISSVACVVYVIGWEISLALAKTDFVAVYSKAMMDSARAKDPSPAAMAAAQAQVDSFVKIYANPVLRVLMTFIEMFPVGLLVSLITAGVLRNPRVLPARAPSTT
jgi:hypothetical protein